MVLDIDEEPGPELQRVIDAYLVRVRQDLHRGRLPAVSATHHGNQDRQLSPSSAVRFCTPQPCLRSRTPVGPDRAPSLYLTLRASGCRFFCARSDVGDRATEALLVFYTPPHAAITPSRAHRTSRTHHRTGRRSRPRERRRDACDPRLGRCHQTRSGRGLSRAQTAAALLRSPWPRLRWRDNVITRCCAPAFTAITNRPT